MHVNPLDPVVQYFPEPDPSELLTDTLQGGSEAAKKEVRFVVVVDPLYVFWYVIHTHTHTCIYIYNIYIHTCEQQVVRAHVQRFVRTTHWWWWLVVVVEVGRGGVDVAWQCR